MLCIFSKHRLGRNGIAEIKKHRFFVTDLWDWDTIRTSELTMNKIKLYIFSLQNNIALTTNNFSN